MKGEMNGQMDRWTDDGGMDRWMDGRKEERTDGPMHGWREG